MYGLLRQGAADEAQQQALAERLCRRLPAALTVLEAHPALAGFTRFALVQLLVDLWLPLAEGLAGRVFAGSQASTGERSHAEGVTPSALSEAQPVQRRPYVQGLLGVQGTGKTTWGVVLGLLLELRGLRLVSLSLDDYYLTFEERRQLAVERPELRWRGPPGTHDITLACADLDALRRGEGRQLTRFDKALEGGQGDRVPGEWVDANAVDIVLFEGWCVGLRPLAVPLLALPDARAAEDDADFATASNAALTDYLRLWERLDGLWVLKPEDYTQSLRWRQEAEQKLRAAGGGGMSDAEIADFVRYFWKSLHPLRYLNPPATWRAPELLVEVGPDRMPLHIQVA